MQEHVLRPWGTVTAGRSVEVERERVRAEATDSIAAAERGAHAEAVEILRSCSAPWRGPPRRGRGLHVPGAVARAAGDARTRGRPAAVRAVRARVRACRAELARAAAHHVAADDVRRRRGGDAGRRLDAAGATTSYMMPAMLDMLNQSRRSRELRLPPWSVLVQSHRGSTAFAPTRQDAAAAAEGTGEKTKDPMRTLFEYGESRTPPPPTPHLESFLFFRAPLRL
jgi:hypothetical protein